SQETEFQRFPFELAKRKVCPNLLPQTGPTGGGDSKVDTETYPVADNPALTLTPWQSGNHARLLAITTTIVMCYDAGRLRHFPSRSLAISLPNWLAQSAR